MYKSILKLSLIFMFGIFGGVLATQIIWPYFVERPLINKYQLASFPFSVNETKEIIIEENTALQDAVEKVKKSIVGIKTNTKTGKIITGSGLVITSDGLIITLSELVPRKSNPVFFINGETPNWQILKRDEKNNLVLIKLTQNDLTTVGFADFDKIKLGQRIFLLGSIFNERKSIKAVNEGIIKFFTNGYIRTNIIEKDAFSGSALFNIKGELLGLNTIDTEGMVAAISITKIREFIGY